MKIKSYLLMLLTAVAFTACNDDKEEAPAQDVAGTYTGYTSASSAYFSDRNADNQTVTVTAIDDTHATITYTSDDLGTYSYESAVVTKNGDTYTIAGEGTATMGMHGASAKEYESTVSGQIVNGSATFTFVCPSVMGGMTIAFQPGTAPQN
jgi:hypothetical protein